MTMKMAQGDRTGALATFQGVWRVFACVSLIAAAIVVVAGLAAPQSWVPGTSAKDQLENSLTLFVLVLFAVVCHKGSVMQAGFQCSGGYPVGISLSAASGLVEGLSAVMIVVLGGSLSEVALSCLVLRSASLLLRAVSLTRTMAWPRFGVGHASRSEIRNLRRPPAAAMASPLAQATILQGTAIAIGLSVSPAVSPPTFLIPLMTAVRLMQGCRHPLSNLLLAVNRQSIYSFTYLAASCVSLVSTFAFAARFGVAGAGLALLLVDIFMAFHIGWRTSAHLLRQDTAAGALAALASAGRRLSRRYRPTRRPEELAA